MRTPSDRNGEPRFQFSLRALLVVGAVAPLAAFVAYQAGGAVAFFFVLFAMLALCYLVSFALALAFVVSVVFFADRAVTVWTHRGPARIEPKRRVEPRDGFRL